MPADPNKASPGFDIDTLLGGLKAFAPVQVLEKLVKTAAEVWEKIKGAVGYIVKIIKNWFNDAVEAIEGVIKGIAEKGLVRYLGDVVKERVGERGYRIIQPLFDKFAAVEDKLMSLLDEPFPSSIDEAPAWIWNILRKLLGIGWSTIGALVSGIDEVIANIGGAIGELLTHAVERGMIGVERHAYWIGIPGVSEYNFLAATEYKIDILGSGIYFKEEGILNNPKSAVGVALFEVLEAWGVPPTNTAVDPHSGEAYNDRWVGGKGAL
jgi:phage-related protein